MGENNSYFKRVYIGGHHEVFCNGEVHFKLVGNALGSAPISKNNLGMSIEQTKCDCEQWAKTASRKR